jgi:Fe-S oxidoreductase
VDEIRQSQPGFENLKVPMDKKGATLFLNQHSAMPLEEPSEMGPLWKILHLSGVDWTYGSTGWAAENFCYFLADSTSWEDRVRRQARAVERLECQVLVNTEFGHNFFALKQGLAQFRVPHSFEVKSIIEYYAQWIREGRLKVSSDWNLDRKIRFTVQDPCQLVRKSYGNFIAGELRFVICQAVGEENFVDMYPNGANNYCCGGGGGAMYTDFTEERMAYGRVKLDQILETEAAYCITPCSSCHRQILDLSRHYQARFRTIHLWTILCLAMGVLAPSERKYLGADLSQVELD